MLYFDLFGWRLVTVKKGMAPLHVFLTFFQVLFVNLQRPPIQPGGCKDVQKLDKSIMVFAFFFLLDETRYLCACLRRAYNG